MWFFHNPGLLGINARNLIYIRAYNPKKAVMLADSKIKTKNYLSARGVPVDVMIKRYNGAIYLFAVAMRNRPTGVTFTIRDNAFANARVEVFIVSR